MKLPKLSSYTLKGSTGTGDYFSGLTGEALKIYALKVQQIEIGEAIGAATDTCGFNRASAGLEGQIRTAIMNLLTEEN